LEYYLVPRIVLEGGTDIAEMALFSVDELPSGDVSKDTLSGLVDKNQAIRMPTGGDGGYLLYLYVDEEIPVEIRNYCVEDDVLRSEFRANSGRVAFGGAESMFTKFEPNPYIRSDTRLPPGLYDAVAHHTEYPDDLIEDAVENAIGADGRRTEDFSSYIGIGTVALTVALFILGGFITTLFAFGIAAATVIAGRYWYKSYTDSDEYKRIKEQRREVENEYPSIVIELAKRGA
jgi:hypothetical protein